MLKHGKEPPKAPTRKHGPTMMKTPLTRFILTSSGVGLLLTGCSQSPERWETPEPTDAAELFIGAVHYHNSTIAWNLLTPEAQNDLEKRAEKTRRLACRSDDRTCQDSIQGHQMLSSAGFLDPFMIKSLKKSPDSTDEKASVELTTWLGQTHTLHMNRRNDVWRIQLPTN